jgi:hypothetical protein
LLQLVSPVGDALPHSNKSKLQRSMQSIDPTYFSNK